MAAIDPTDYLALEEQQKSIERVKDAIDELETTWLETIEALEED